MFTLLGIALWFSSVCLFFPFFSFRIPIGLVRLQKIWIWKKKTVENCATNHSNRCNEYHILFYRDYTKEIFFYWHRLINRNEQIQVNLPTYLCKSIRSCTIAPLWYDGIKKYLEIVSIMQNVKRILNNSIYIQSSTVSQFDCLYGNCSFVLTEWPGGMLIKPKSFRLLQQK